MVPHKFVPLFELMEEAYNKTDVETAATLAQMIIDKPVKVKSYKINIIRNRANEILTTQNKKGGDYQKNKGN